MGDKDLNLSVEEVGDGLKVSWTDITSKPDWGFVGYIAFGVGVIGGALVMIPVAVNGGLIALPIWMAVVIATPILARRPEEKPNTVTFGRKVTTLNGDRQIPTADISRIEYGPETALTGAKTKTAFATEQDEPQTLIRLWVQDSHAVDISLNRWQTQVNHKIRDALDRALTQVRQGQAKAERVATYGQQDDKGMPDY